ncbi:MAG: folate-binding protein, partial [Pseudomonadota bacterium]|nr:folate-binding protein [Pseudomonadota bacterium]
MTDWHQFLAQRAADANHAGPDGNFVTVLAHLGLIRITGEDAANFLHNQVTNDVLQLGTDQARLAGYCTPKGRLLASVWMWRAGDAIVLALDAALQAAVQKRLQMYVLRAKVSLADISAEQVLLGLGGPAAGALLQQWFAVLPEAPFQKVDSAHGTLMRMADADGKPRFQWMTTPAQVMALWPTLSAALAPVTDNQWWLGDIAAGIPQVTLATQEQFVPQMINFDLIGGVNFKKGCYPGQEIVARSQYLGKQKRRMLAATVAAERVGPGDE